MFFSRVASLTVLALGVISAAATPAVVKKREDVSDVLAVVNTLKASTSAIIPQIDALAASDSTTQDQVSPVFTNLVAALNTASTSLNGLQGKVDTSSGGSPSDVANSIAPVYTEITTSLDNFKKHKPQFGFLFITFGIDAALNKVLIGLELVVAGVLKLVGVLLFAVGGLLQGLGFVLTFATLGFVGLF
ncbi:hypothetical protein BDQ17DRAFT_1326327 [Cyathus striatus]|nr:hypothetical protein BDQ17DRAFT_1326327 [Cyathus striatus]